MLSICLLGAPQIMDADHQPVPIARRKSRALLYYLAAHPTSVARDHLLAFFWPDADRQGAQQNFRSTLYGLRKILGDLVQAEDDTIALAATVTVDARTFVTQLAQTNASLSALQATLALYRGDFLSDFTLPDLPEFDDWAAVERTRYQRLALSGYTRLSRLYEAQHDYRAALDALDHALALEPLQEDVQRNALRLQYLAGDRAGAIRRYETLRTLLAEEMGVPPMEETQTLYDAIITDTLPAPASNNNATTVVKSAPESAPAAMEAVALPPFTTWTTPVAISLARQGVPALPFVGRQRELQRLTELATAHHLLLIEGESGIGKSRLLEEFIEQRQQRDAPLVLLGQARELEATLPYQPLLEALRTLFTQPQWPKLLRDLDLNPLWRTEVARLLPELADERVIPSPATPAVDELRLWEGISRFLLALARQRPLVLAFDDLHWADASTISLLGYLLRKAAQQGASITFVATARPVIAPAPLALLLETLLREGRLQRFPLQRLTTNDIAHLAQQITVQEPGALAAWLTELSEGNPFILIELLYYARDQHLLLPDGRTNLQSAAATQVVPQTVYALIRARLARLSESARQVLNAASVIGREFEIETVARTAALSDAAVLNSLDELQTAGLIQPLTGLRYQFDHQLTLEVAYQEMGEPRHRLLHRRVGEAMEEIYHQRIESVAGLLAHHFAEGHQPERVAQYAFLAGQGAAKLAAWREAIAFYEQAATAATAFTDQSQHQRILAALGQAALHAGQNGRAADALRLALRLKERSRDPLDEELLYADLIEALMLGTRYGELLTLAAQVNGHGRAETASFVEYFRGIALAQMGSDLDDAVRHLQKAEALLTQSPMVAVKGVVTLGDVKFELGNIAARRGDLLTAVAYFRDAFAVSQAMGSDRELRVHILACNNLAYHLHLQGDPTAADYAHRGLTLAQEKGALAALPYLYSTLGEIALAHNALDKAEQYFQEGLTLAQQFAAAERVAGLTANLGLVAKARGDQAPARRLLLSALEQMEALNIRFSVAQIRLWVAPLLPPEAAHSQLAQARQIAAEDGYQQLQAEGERLELEVAIGR
jgi:predicted ATPase/DNA-binding SARP family transcriptional activator